MLRHLVLSAGFFAIVLLPAKAYADVSLSDVFAACEARVVQSANSPLLNLGEVIDQCERQKRIRMNSDAGVLVATIFPPPFGNVLDCILWGSQSDSEARFANEWQDWVEWEEAEQAARNWHQNSL
ncbi:MAG: hypothetical protein NXH97_00040 [Rhodobacteraceae bacterium]|nr:hypothetical protein [Paracoccaceae bacterium]